MQRTIQQGAAQSSQLRHDIQRLATERDEALRARDQSQAQSTAEAQAFMQAYHQQRLLDTENLEKEKIAVQCEVRAG